jgi:hypothetical protein
MKGAVFQGHVKLAGGPVFRVTVCADYLEYLDPTVTFQVYDTTLQRDRHLANGIIAWTVDTDLPIGLELGELRPVQLTQ